MANSLRRPGATLPELLILLALCGILAGVSIPVTMKTRDGIAVRAARDLVAGEFARASALARLHGSARTWVDPAGVRVESPIGVARDARSIEHSFGVVIAIDGASAAVAFDFDALGLGRLANRTIRFRRNAAEAGLTLSTHGRPRRW